MTKGDHNFLYFKHSSGKPKTLRHYQNNTLKLDTDLTDDSKMPITTNIWGRSPQK